MRITLIIPAHNEEEIIADTIRNIEETLDLDYQVIVINDHSIDKTADIVRGLMQRYSNLRLIDNEGERGFANALKKGFSVVDEGLVIPMMADLCDDPRTIKDMYARALEGSDIVCGCRYMRGGKKNGGPLLQSFFSRFVGCSLKYLIGMPTSDVSNSFKCYRKNVLEAIEIESSAFEISMEIALKAYFLKFKITEVPTTWKGRVMGKSKFYLFKIGPDYLRLYLWAIYRRICAK